MLAGLTILALEWVRILRRRFCRFVHRYSYSHARILPTHCHHMREERPRRPSPNHALQRTRYPLAVRVPVWFGHRVVYHSVSASLIQVVRRISPVVFRWPDSLRCRQSVCGQLRFHPCGGSLRRGCRESGSPCAQDARRVQRFGSCRVFLEICSYRRTSRFRQPRDCLSVLLLRFRRGVPDLCVRAPGGALGFLDALPPDARHFSRPLGFRHRRPPRLSSPMLLSLDWFSAMRTVQSSTSIPEQYLSS